MILYSAGDGFAGKIVGGSLFQAFIIFHSSNDGFAGKIAGANSEYLYFDIIISGIMASLLGFITALVPFNYGTFVNLVFLFRGEILVSSCCDEWLDFFPKLYIYIFYYHFMTDFNIENF